MKKTALVLVMIIGIGNVALWSDSLINQKGAPVQVFFEAEQGAAAVLYHTIQIGDGGTTFDYRTQGGQEILFPFNRFTAGMTIQQRHRVSFLYQPLTVVTNVRFKDDVTIDDVTFDDGTPMEITYGFPFYRVTYGYQLLKDSSADIYIGAALQLRNASLVFKQIDGEDKKLTVSQNLGPVPALYAAAAYTLESGLVLRAEATGLYASSRFINGADFDFTGSILDASLRMGYQLKNNVEVFGNIRFLGGSASGDSEYERKFWTQSEETFTENYLATLTITLGALIF